MVPFQKICPKLAQPECRTIHFVGDAKAGEQPADQEVALFESFCTEKDCDCRRVMLTAASENAIEATISFGFDPDDDLRGPFLDPLGKQGADAAELLVLVRDAILTDPEYVARLERHYAITKDIIAGRLRPEDAQPSPRIMTMTDLRKPLASQRPRVENSVVDAKLIDASFDIRQEVFDEDGEEDEDLATEYREELGKRFAQSPEAQPLLEGGSDLTWAETMMYYGINYFGSTPPTLSVGEVSEVVFELFPRKVSLSASESGEVIAELRAFWRFLQREYQLENAAPILKLLGPGAEERLHDALDDPANFGMAKSILMLGQEAGFDMRTEAGLAAFMLAYNSRHLGNRATVGRPTSPQEPSRRLSMFANEEPPPQFSNRAERRAAERVKLREEKKRQKQAKRQDRR